MSTPYETIACFIDRDEASDVALAEARRLYEMGSGSLHLVHVAPEPLLVTMGPYGPVPDQESLFREAEEWVRAKAAEIPGTQPVVRSGHPPAAACEYAEEAGVDLIVIAAYRRVLRRAMLGSFASYIAYRAPCPVLVVRPETAGR